MAICFRYFPCHLEMGLTVAATGTHLHYCQLNYAKAISGPGFGLRLSYGYRRVKFVVSAELSNAFSVNIDLDSQVIFFLLLFS